MQMKIVTWNCNGALRNKFEYIAKLDADIYIVQECEDPDRTRHKGYQEWSSNYIWKGPNKNKGIGIFCRDGIQIQYLSWPSGSLELFLPIRINDEFNLVGVWTKQAKSPNFRYIGQFWKFLQDHWRSMAKEPVIIAGDFNSNTRWDEWDRWWNHSDVVNQLASLNIHSLYHSWHNEEQGEESIPTLHLQRKKEKPYHIDYIFASKRIHDSAQDFQIGLHDDWIQLSDHMPISVNLTTI